MNIITGCGQGPGKGNEDGNRREGEGKMKKRVLGQTTGASLR